jgi:hypothetical protein
MADALFGVLACIKGLILHNHWYSINSIKHIKYPFLFISCKLTFKHLLYYAIAGKDEIVPPIQMKRLFKAVSHENKEWV